MVSNGRLLFIDLMRGLAMVVMIEVHVVNALIRPGYRHLPWFSLVDFINGLVAPSFLFVAGFVFYQSLRGLQSSSSAGLIQLGPKAGRLALIWVIGYLLHCPAFSLSVWQKGIAPEEWLSFISVDVLQCIAASLLIIALIRVLFSRDDRAVWLVALLGVLAVCLASPLYRAGVLAAWPAPLAVYVIPYGKTLFPLLPWFGFVAAGAVSSFLYAEARTRDRVWPNIQAHFVAGAVLAGAGLPLLLVLRDHLHWIVDERPHVLFFAARLGFVCLIFCACFWVCRTRQTLSPLLAYPARETLLIYCLHLQLLYHPFGQAGSLAQALSAKVSFAGCLAISGGILALLLPVAWLWHSGKSRYPWIGSATVGGGGLLMIAWFLST